MIKAKQRSNALSIEGLRESLREDLTREELKSLSGWELVGNVLVVELDESLGDKKYLIGRRLLDLHPRAKTVVNRYGIFNEYREPKVEIIVGNGTETIHKENGCFFKIDPAKVMFSFGNFEERRRMARVSNKDEEVLDMFAGIGQFTIPLAKFSNPKKCYAIEKNPVAFEYLEENIRINNLKNVQAILGDCTEVSPRGEVDRVIMGYIFDTHKYLPTAIRALEDGGIIHYHTLCKKSEVQSEYGTMNKISRAYGYKSEIIYNRAVKSYAPRIYHFVLDVRLTREG